MEIDMGMTCRVCGRELGDHDDAVFDSCGD